MEVEGASLELRNNHAATPLVPARPALHALRCHRGLPYGATPMEGPSQPDTVSGQCSLQGPSRGPSHHVPTTCVSMSHAANGTPLQVHALAELGVCCRRWQPLYSRQAPTPPPRAAPRQPTLTLSPTLTVAVTLIPALILALALMPHALILALALMPPCAGGDGDGDATLCSSSLQTG